MSVYAVYWPDRNIFKIGTSDRRKARWRAFVNRGAVLLGTKDDLPTGISDYDFEWACHQSVGAVCRRAFRSAAEAIPYLGGQGGGYCECYRVPGDLMPSEILAFIDSQLEALCG